MSDDRTTSPDGPAALADPANSAHPRDPAALADLADPRDPADQDGPGALDPAEGLRIIAAQTAKVRSREPDTRLIFGAWGVAWLVGYLALYLTTTGRVGQPSTTDGVAQPATWAFVLFSVCIVGAMALTIGHSIRANAGIQGFSASSGAMYGWTWCLGFAGMSVMLGGLARAGASPEVMSLAANSSSCLLVGVLYMASGAFCQERQLYAIGVWIILVAAISVFAGLPDTYLVMAVLGSGGFFVGMVLEQVRRRRDPARLASTTAGPTTA